MKYVFVEDTGPDIKKVKNLCWPIHMHSGSVIEYLKSVLSHHCTLNCKFFTQIDSVKILLLTRIARVLRDCSEFLVGVGGTFRKKGP